MFKQQFGKQLSGLKLTNSELVDKLSEIINNNFSAAQAENEAVQNKLTEAHINAWKKGKAYPTNSIIRDAISILLTGNRGNYGSLIITTPADAKEILSEALIIYNNKIINNLCLFKKNCLNGYYDRIKNNPYSSKVTTTDIMGCIAYLLIQGYLYSHPFQKKKLNSKIYSEVIDINTLIKNINTESLLYKIQKYINGSGKFDKTALKKQALLILLKIIKNESFFN